MKTLALMTTLSSAVFLWGCSETPKQAEPATPATAVADCVFPNSAIPAPGWICDEPVAGIEVSAVGIAEPSKAGLSYMKDMAAADARGRLAEQMQVQVQKMVKQYLGTTGVGQTETVDAAASSTLKTISNQTLTGSKIYKTRTGPDGKLYALVGIDAQARAKIVENAVKTSMRNEQALWQEFKAKQSFDEMAAGIAQQIPQ
ncbi:MAG: LPP20 family lipoprotein [Thiotrichales bacterium]|nr:LPP20 family lipoprotein [Thiotrichales bacterium]